MEILRKEIDIQIGQMKKSVQTGMLSMLSSDHKKQKIKQDTFL